MDPAIIAAIITGGCTIIAALIGALVVRGGISNLVKQKVTGNGNNLKVEVKNENTKTK